MNSEQKEHYPIKGAGLKMSLMQLFGVGPKWRFQCSKCGKAWKERLVPGADNPLIVCPHCGNSNRMDIQWGDGYNG